MKVGRFRLRIMAAALLVALVVPVSAWAAGSGSGPQGPVSVWQSLIDFWEGWTLWWNDREAESELGALVAASKETTSDDPKKNNEEEPVPTVQPPLGLDSSDGGDTEGGPGVDPGG